MILSRTDVASRHRFFLFDTFDGIPADRLTNQEQAEGFGGRLAETSADYVDALLAPWRPGYQICAGDIFETLETSGVGDLSFAHIDLNAVAPSLFTLAFVYPRMVKGGIIAFDDYGGAGFEEQRSAIDEFFAELPETPIALPTSQGFVIKL